MPQVEVELDEQIYVLVEAKAEYQQATLVELYGETSCSSLIQTTRRCAHSVGASILRSDPLVTSLDSY